MVREKRRHNIYEIVIHQSVIFNFKNGSTGYLNMVSGSSERVRDIRIVCTKVEIISDFKNQKFFVQTINHNIDEL